MLGRDRFGAGSVRGGHGGGAVGVALQRCGSFGGSGVRVAGWKTEILESCGGGWVSLGAAIGSGFARRRTAATLQTRSFGRC